VYVDDILVTGSDEAKICDLKLHLDATFKTKDLGFFQLLLGLGNIAVPIGPYSYLEEIHYGFAPRVWLC